MRHQKIETILNQLSTWIQVLKLRLSKVRRERNLSTCSPEQNSSSATQNGWFLREIVQHNLRTGGKRRGEEHLNVWHFFVIGHKTNGNIQLHADWFLTKSLMTRSIKASTKQLVAQSLLLSKSVPNVLQAMWGRISQEWYEFTTGDGEIDRYCWVSRLLIENVDRCDWDYRLVIENVDHYGWDYRLLIENNGRYGPKNNLISCKTDDCYGWKKIGVWRLTIQNVYCYREWKGLVISEG